MTITSPCTDVCEIDPDTDLCRGCSRTLDEIAAWVNLSDGQRQDILNSIAARKRQNSAS